MKKVEAIIRPHPDAVRTALQELDVIGMTNWASRKRTFLSDIRVKTTKMFSGCEAEFTVPRWRHWMKRRRTMTALTPSSHQLLLVFGILSTSPQCALPGSHRRRKVWLCVNNCCKFPPFYSSNYGNLKLDLWNNSDQSVKYFPDNVIYGQKAFWIL
jgi:hypothetical protein